MRFTVFPIIICFIIFSGGGRFTEYNPLTEEYHFNTDLSANPGFRALPYYDNVEYADHVEVYSDKINKVTRTFLNSFDIYEMGFRILPDSGKNYFVSDFSGYKIKEYESPASENTEYQFSRLYLRDTEFSDKNNFYDYKICNLLNSVNIFHDLIICNHGNYLSWNSFRKYYLRI